ncbi:hypothetical protein ACFSR7_12880 [Cohnella sp. GCM10020058]|uniref:hypothetical protein n=1 Tax=Cohnella sp. GCM10020058 TaxID=3317330 RepID=UPI00363EDDF5
MNQNNSSQRSIKDVYKKAVIEKIKQSMDLDESQAGQLFEKYYQSVYKYWGMEPNAEDFAEKILNINELTNRLGAKIIKNVTPTASILEREKLIERIKNLPDEKLLLIEEFLKKIIPQR